MNSKVVDIIRKTKKVLGKHSPEILTGIGITGMITTTVLAVKATPKAMDLILKKKYELDKEDLTVVETVQAAWKPYVPAVVTCVFSTTCLIGASAVNVKRNAALATAYAISEKALTTYRDKVVETIGEKKEKEIRGKIAQDEVDKKDIVNSQVIITAGGNTLCMDSISGRVFRSSMDKIQKVVNELNRRMTYENYISLDEFYSELGLESTKNSSYLGWNLDDGLIEVKYDSCLAENGEPCLYIDYMVAPRYEFDKLM